VQQSSSTDEGLDQTRYGTSQTMLCSFSRRRLTPKTPNHQLHHGIISHCQHEEQQA